MREAIEQFRAAIHNTGLTPPEVIEPDGRLHRFAANGKRSDDAGWYVLHDDGIPAGAFGDWRSGTSETWRADIGRRLSAQEEAAHRTRIEAMRREREAEEARRKAEARDKAAAIWQAALLAADHHPYLIGKGVKAHGLRLHNGALIVPMRDGAELHSLQFINADGEKRFLAGGRVSGCYFSLGQPNSTLCVAEGYATGASIHEATGYAVAVAFNAGNLLPVARALRAKFPDLRLIVCADDDTMTDGNPGLTKAGEAAQAVGGRLAVPDFGAQRPGGATDFNDLHRHAGPAAVSACIEAAAHVDSSASPEGWPEPKPIIAELKPVPAFDADTLLPGALRAWVMDEAERMPWPPEFIAAAARAMRERFPAALLAILADVLDSGEPDSRAVEAARAVGAALAVPDFGADRPEGATDFNDLAAHRGPGAAKRAIDAAIASAGGNGTSCDDRPASGDSGGWPEPQPLTARIRPEPYPADALPDGIGAAVREVAAFVQAPFALVASSALGALSLAAQARADVKRADRLQGPSGLFMLTVADSGERKTTCDGFFTQAIRGYEAEQAELAKPALKEHSAAIAAWTAEREGILSAIKEAGKKGKPADKLRADLAELEREKPVPPRVPRLIYGDATPEALTWGLAMHWPSAGIVSSEAAAIFGSHGMGRESIMRNLGILNQLWDGARLTFDRRTSDSYTVRGARLTVALQVQEATLRDFFGRSGALARGSGFLARFMVAWPESTQGQRPFAEAPASWPALAVFNRRIAAILAEPVPMDDDGVLTPPVVGFTAEARRDWIAFHNNIEAELCDGGELRDVRDVAAKAADNAARLAALFHAFVGGGGAISATDFAGAARIVAWHLNEARRFFGELALPAELADAARLDAWLIGQCRRDGGQEVGRREAQRCGPVRDADRLSAALRVLAELDRAREGTDGKRRPIRVNPALLTGTGQ